MKGRNLRRISSFLCLSVLAIIPVISSAQDHGFSGKNADIHYTRTRTYDIHHLKLGLSFDQPQQMVYGKAILTISPITNSLDQVVLDAVDLDIKSVTINDSLSVAHSSNDGKLEINLGRAYQKEDTFAVVIEYSAQPKAGLYFVRPEIGYPDKPWQIWSQGEAEFNSHWFPCYDFPNDRMTSEMIVTVPKGQIAISNGELLDITENDTGNTVTYHWKENVPHVTYLVSLVVGEYFEKREEWQGIPITYYVEQQDSDKIARSFSKTVDMMDFFSQKIGIDYPYEKYAQTTIREFMWGGMENISASTLTRNTLHDERAHLDYTSDGLVAHELAHQWWGDLITCKNWNHVWLNEAFATYFDALYVEHDMGINEFIMEMQENRDRYLTEDSTRYRRPIVYNLYEDPSQMFDRHTYQKGAWVLHMLRYVLGDELWWKAIKHYGKKFAERTVDTNDFQQAVEEATGEKLDWFFDKWLHSGGYPEYLVNWIWDDKKSAVLVDVEQIQIVDEVTPIFRMPVEIEISGDFDPKTFTIEVSQKQETFWFELPSKPEWVEFDPREKILKELEFTKSKKELLNQLRHSNHIIGKMRASKWLAEYRDDGEVINTLAHAVTGREFWGVRRQAAKTLGKIDKRDARDALITALRDDKSDVRIAAIKSLAQFEDDDRVVKALLDVVEKDSSYYVQAEAVRSVAKISPETGYDISVQALFKDSHDEVIREAAFDGFVRMKDPRGINHAIVWAAYGKPTRVRVRAIRAMEELLRYDESRKETIYQRLSSFLEEDNFRIRNASVRALGNLGRPEVLPHLEKMAENEYHFKWKEIIERAIRKIKMRNAKERDENSLGADSLKNTY